MSISCKTAQQIMPSLPPLTTTFNSFTLCSIHLDLPFLLSPLNPLLLMVRTPAAIAMWRALDAVAMGNMFATINAFNPSCNKSEFLLQSHDKSAFFIQQVAGQKMKHVAPLWHPAPTCQSVQLHRGRHQPDKTHCCQGICVGSCRCAVLQSKKCPCGLCGGVSKYLASQCLAMEEEEKGGGAALGDGEDVHSPIEEDNKNKKSLCKN